jgi:hypothetical protein
MPARSTIYRWLDEHADFALLYSYAMKAKIEGFVEETVEIADDSKGDYKIEMMGEGSNVAVAVLDKEAIARSKLRIETRQWLAKVMLPRKYGDLAGKEPPPPTQPAAPAYGGGPMIDVTPNKSPPPISAADPLADELGAYERVAKAQ